MPPSEHQTLSFIKRWQLFLIQLLSLPLSLSLSLSDFLFSDDDLSAFLSSATAPAREEKSSINRYIHARKVRFITSELSR